LSDNKGPNPKKAVDEQAKAVENLKAAIEEAKKYTPEEQKEYIRNFILLAVTLSFIFLVFIKIWVAYQGGSTGTQQAVDTALALMTGYFGAVLYYLGIRQGGSK
jgi:hypothetical protein